MATKRTAPEPQEPPTPARLTLEWILRNRKVLPNGKPLNASSLSRAAGLARGHVDRNIKNNAKNMNRETIAALAREGRVPVEWFYSGPTVEPVLPLREPARVQESQNDWPAFEEAAAKAEGAGVSAAAIKSVRIGRGKLKEADTAQTLYEAMIQAEREIRHGAKLVAKPLDDD